MWTALLAGVLAVGLSGCADAGDDARAPVAPGTGPDRPGAGGEELAVDPLPLEAPVLLDPVPAALEAVELGYTPPEGNSGWGRGTLYGDPALADTLDGPVLLIGGSGGSAQIGGPRYEAPGRDVDLGGRTARVVPDGDRTWVVFQGNDTVDFVVGRGIAEDDLVEAARGADFGTTATIAPDAVPAGLAPLVVGGPPDGPGGPGEDMFLVGDSTWISVTAVRADPRLAALWGFWADDATGTVIRGEPGSAGVLRGTYLGGPAAPGRVWAEDGMVLAVIVTLDRAGEGEELLDQVVSDLRVGTWDEFEAARRRVLERPPTPDELPCGADGGFVGGVDDGHRWAFALYPNTLAGLDEWGTCYTDLTTGGGGGGTIAPPPPLGALAVTVGGFGIMGGVAPPGTVHVTVTAPEGSTRDAVLADVGPRPGERVWGTFLPGDHTPTTSATPPYVFWSITATAYDAAGLVLDSTTV